MRLLWLLGLTGCVFVTDADQQQWQALYGDADGDGYVVADDCDDGDAGVHPGHAESCDGKDEDCDDAIDEDATDVVTSWRDADEDGFGDEADSTSGCEVPSGYVDNSTDCDDGDDALNPEAPETCNTLDDDCDDAVDEEVSEIDEDGDGWGFCDDCDDGDPEVNPGRFEWVDGKDNDCDDLVDSTDLGAADVLLTGKVILQSMGYLVAEVGDIDQDGFDDVLVGAYLEHEDDRGAAHLVLGGDDVEGSVVSRMVFEGPNANAQAGWYVDGAGDIDRDGIPDLLIGAHFTENDAGEAVGAAYLVYGGDLDFTTGSEGETLNLSKFVELLGPEDDGKTGRCACGAGDIDGDGFDDLMVGAVHNASLDGKSRAGTVYLVTSTPLADMELEDEYDGVVRGVNQKDRIGRWCRQAGDLEGDGLDDVVMGVPYLDSEAGRVLVYSGDVGGIGERTIDDADVSLTASSTDGYVGWAVDATTDLDGDGYLDLVVGNPKEHAEIGEVWLAYGPVSSVDLDNPDIVFEGENAIDNAGNRVRFIDDLDGDGAPELAISARLNDRAEDNAGTVYVIREFSDGTHSLADADAFLTGDDTIDYAQAGLSLDQAGDFNGDGFMDLIVGSPNADKVGSAAIVFGGE